MKRKQIREKTDFICDSDSIYPAHSNAHEQIPRSTCPLHNNLRNADLFYMPQPNKELFRRFPLYTFPSAWNAADDNKYNPNSFTFIRSLKDSMFESLE